MRPRTPSAERGFTLVEILLVVSVIAILGGAAYQGVVQVRRSTQEQKLQQDVDTINRAIPVYETFDGQLAPDLKGFLDETGLGNHPAMVRLAVKLSKLTKQDGYIVGGLPSPGNGKGPAPKDYAARLYPNLKQG